jgi:hypothetical protein
MILKRKGLLFFEQPFDVLEGLPSCGEWGIRTRGPFDKSTVFKTAAIDHSANSPLQKYKLNSILQTVMGIFLPEIDKCLKQRQKNLFPTEFIFHWIRFFEQIEVRLNDFDTSFR